VTGLIFSSHPESQSEDWLPKDIQLQEGVNFLTKPFEAHKLAQTVRQKLDANI
jgi:hypothetical protein